MSIDWAVDWLAYNSQSTYELNHQAMAYKPELYKWLETKGTFGYDKAIETADNVRIMWSTTRKDMGTFASYSGRALSAYRDREISTVEIMAHHNANGDVCRRLDLAIDAYDTGIDIYKLYRELVEGKATTKVKKYNLITGSAGDTLYIGSRESEQFIRIYDKAKEQGDFKADRVRIELELKGSRAEQFSRWLATASEGSAIARTQQLTNSIITFKAKQWLEIMGSEAVGLAKPKDELPDTERWLMQSVAPAMAKYINKSGNRALLVRFIRVVTALTSGDIDN